MIAETEDFGVVGTTFDAVLNLTDGVVAGERQDFLRCVLAGVVSIDSHLFSTVVAAEMFTRPVNDTYEQKHTVNPAECHTVLMV